MSFSFEDSVLFGAPPEPQMNMSDSILFKDDGKTVRLFNGKTISLRPRKKIVQDVDYSDSILDMDKLHERVSLRDSLRESQKLIRALQPKSQAKSEIWTEKYRPKTFMQLCPAGNEKQYRLVMHWLRKWGSVVFGKDSPPDESTDHLGRPHRKILLVHGPTGVGKTAAVHLLARQMGYSVQELNAANSMDTMSGVESVDGAGRFANATAALKLKIKNALTTNSITANGKPTCLVIDEIDCSINAGDIIKVINDLVVADQRSQRDTDKKKKFTLNRPIICIANDIYSQNVRSYGPNPMDKLRPICEIVAFKGLATGKNPGTRINTGAQKAAKEYLMAISNKEKIGLDSKEIGEVLEVCEGDLRACLNYMQFTSRKLDPSVYAFSGPANKNMDSLVSWFAMVDLIFRRNQQLSKDENFEVMLQRMTAGDGKAAASGSLDKVVRGCFNRYLDVVHYQDDSAVGPAEISDWLYFYDILTCKNREFGFYPSLAALKFWSLFSDANPRTYRDDNSLLPNARGLEFESLELLKQNKAVVKRFSDQLPVDVKLASGGHDFYALHFLPYLDAMLSPEIGSSKVKSSLKDNEKKLVEKLARLTKRFDIKLETQRDMETNQVSLLYAPNWDTITVFDNLFAPVPLASKTKVVHAKRLWLFPLIQSELTAAVAAVLKRQRTESPGPEAAKVKKARMTSSLDFFKNQYDQISTQLSADITPASDHEIARIWVKYHEGFSNAVRKNIGWKELWTA